MKTKLFTLFFALVASVGTVFAESGTCGKNLRWNLTDGVLTISGTGNMYNYYLYSSGLSSSNINTDNPWYRYRSSINSLIIKDGVTSIGNYAFYGCSGLTSIDIPNSVTSIGDEAFKGCSGLTFLTIGNGVTSIGAWAFSGCTGLTKVNITDISAWCNIAFSGSYSNPLYYAKHLYLNDVEVTDLTIPNSVTSIGGYAFSGCTGLTSVTIPNSVESIGGSAFNNCSSLTSVTWNAKNCASPSSSTYAPFSNISSQITSFIIGDEVEVIPAYLCYGMSSLTSVTILNSVTSIGEYAFYNCSGLTSVTIPNSVTSIGGGAFQYCTGLTSVTIPNSVTSIGNWAFHKCSSLTSIEIPNSVTSIGNSAFSGCTGLTSVTIPNSVTSFGESAFYGCTSLTSIEIPNSVTSIGSSAFEGCSGLTSVTIPNSVTSIGSGAFRDCSGLTSVTIGNSVTSFGESAFRDCSGLTSVTIGNSVKSIRNDAFQGCSNITEVTWNARNSSGYNFGSQVESFTFGEEVEVIPANLCSDMNKLTSITIPNSVTSIGKGAFLNCSGLTSITIPNSVESIGGSAFNNCSSLTSVTWNAKNCASPSSSTYAPFSNISSQITSFIIGDEVEVIPAYLCYGMSSLTSVTIPNSVTSIGDEAFLNCSGLTSITIPNSVESIGGSAFNNCSSLTSVTWNAKNCASPSSSTYAPFSNISSQITSFIIGDEVEVIPAYLCYGMSSLTSVTIPNSVTSIGDRTFYGCSSNKVVINHSALDIVKGATTYGYVAYYASEVYSGGNTIGDFVFAKSGDKDYVVKYLGDDCQITLPADYHGSSYGIGVGLFRNDTIINSITIPNAVTSIGDFSFSGCSNLNVVYIGNSVISIGERAFYDCPELYKIIMLPNSVPSGINSAFQSLSGRITYVGNANYESGYDVLGIQRIYTNLSSYFSVDGIVYALVNPSKRTCDIIDCDYSGATTEFSIGNSVVYSKVTLSVDSINTNAFRNNKKMTKLVIDYNHALPSHMASYCSSIDTLIITSHVGNIGTNAFSNCSKNVNAYFNINNSGDISSSAFANCDKLHKLVIADSVKNIGNQAFYQCANIANADIYNNGGIGTQAFRYSSTNNIATYHLHNNGAINDYAFANCTSIKNLVIDTCVSTIGQNAFQKCTRLEDVIIKNNGNIGKQAFEGSSTENPATYVVSNVGSIGESAFANCTSIDTLVISSNVSNIGSYAFSNSSKNTNAYFNINNRGDISTNAFANCDKLYNLIIADSVKNIGNQAFYQCANIANADIYNNGGIGTQAFRYSSTNNIATYHLHNNGAINDYAFANCSSIKNLAIDSCVSTIGQYAFQKCTRLEDVIIKNNGNIGKQAFEGSSTENPATYVVSNVGSIGESAFANCTSIDTLVISSNVGNIGSYAFSNSSKNVNAYFNINNSGDISTNSFANCTGLYNLIIADSVKNIGNQAFYQCANIANADIYNNGGIGTQAFRYSSTNNIATYHLHNNGAINDYAFANCSSIKNLAIDSCVSTIGQYAFQKCISLEDVTIKNNDNIGKQAFEGSSTQSPATYKISNVGFIGESAFANCTSLHKARLGNQISSIGKSAFSACVLLDSISLPNSVASLGNSVFYNCSSLAYIKLSNTISSIGNSAFAGCSALPELFIPKSANTIGQSAFNECSSLAVVSFENGTNTLSLGRNDENKGLFYDCPLDSVFIGRELNYPQTASDGYSPFYRNPSLRSIVVSDFPTKVEANEFYGCTNLYYVYIGNGVQSIGDYAFSGCSLIDYFSFGEKVQTIGAEAFSDCVAMTRLYSYCQTPPTCGASALEDINKWTCTLYIPIGTTDVYSNADQWKDFFFFEESAFVKYTILVDFDSSKGNVTGAGVYEKGTEVVLVATPAEGYNFIGWEDGSKDPVRHIIVNQSAIYTAIFNNLYTITFKNGDEVLQSTELEYGQLPAYNGETPIKQADAQYTYTFAGWSPEIVEVTGDAVYTATFNTTVNEYTITFKDGEEVLQSTEVEYGQIPAYNGEVPTKQADAQYTYTFVGWTPEIVAVTGDAVYTAAFDSVINEYTIIFKNGEEVLQSTEVEYGQVPAYNGEVPTKQADAQYTYTFTGWTPEVVAVTGDAIYTATYNATVNKYTITWKKDDGTTIDQTSVEYGQIPAHEDPSKLATAQYTYTFAGWTPEIVEVTGDAVYTAVFDSIVNEYTITFKNGEEVLQSTEVEYGQIPAYYGETPTKQADAQYTYTFAGWTPEIVEVTGDAVYTAAFDSVINEYTIIFKNGEEVLQSTEVEYGQEPAYNGEVPTKQADAQYTYTFVGWMPEIVAVTGDAVYNAVYDSIVNKYTITFKDGEEVLQSTEVEYGQVPAYNGEIPTKQADAQYTYTFVGWTPEIVAVTGDAVYTATYNATVNKYTITWKQDDGITIDQTSVEYGQIPAHEDPSKIATAQYTYTFAGWTPEVVAVTGDATYTATYNAMVNKYTITWKQDDGTTIDQTTVEYGQIPAHEDPSKLATAQYTYTFAGWTPEIVEVTGDATYTAMYNATVNKYTITFKNGEEVLQSTEIEYGQIPTYYGEIPTKQADAQYTYTFAGWSPEIVAVTEDATYTAVFNSTINKYTVTWKQDDGTTIDLTIVEYGQIPAHEEPSKQATAEFSYTFAGWTPEVVAVKGDATYTATYSSTKHKYTITFKDDDGSVLCSDEWEYGAMPSCDEPTKEDDEQYSYTFAGWTPEVVTVVSEANYTATYNATPKPQGIDDVTSENAPRKVVIDNKVYIQRGDKTYTVTGQEVR